MISDSMANIRITPQSSALMPQFSSTTAPFRALGVGNFYEMLQLHIECCVESGTLHDDLLAHGWKMRKRDIVPPTFSVLMKKPEMKKLMTGNIDFEKVVVPARIPAFA